MTSNEEVMIGSNAAWTEVGLGSESGIEYLNSGSLWEVHEVVSLNSSKMLILM